LLHDDGTVMQGSAGAKDGDQQIVGQVGVERYSTFDKGAQADLALDDNQRSGDRLGKVVGRKYDVFVAVGAIEDAAAAGRKQSPEPRQGVPYFCAKDHNQREDCIGQDVGDDPVNGLKLFEVRDPKRSGQDGHSYQHRDCTRALDELQELIYDKCHYKNIDDGERRHLRHVMEYLEHPGSLSGEGTAPCIFILNQWIGVGNYPRRKLDTCSEYPTLSIHYP